MSLTQDTDIIKHSAAIQITNEVSLLQRRAWNALLGNAYKFLPYRDKHHIPLQELEAVLGFDSKNEQYLKENLKALVQTTVEWNILGKDKESDWGVSGLLADVRIRKGVCYYSYGAFLKEMLYNPRMYAKISLSMQNKFKSKHALALYELFVDYLDVSRGEGETPFIPIVKFRKMMGIKKEQYSEFKKLNKWVITDPIAEINEKSNLTAEVKYQRESRKVDAVKFVIRQKEETPLLHDAVFEPARITVSDIKIEEIRLHGSKQFVQELRERKISEKDAERFVEQYEPGYLERKIEYYNWLVDEAVAGRIPKSQAPRTGKWLKSCIEEDWQPPAGFKTRAEREKESLVKNLLKAAQWYLDSSEYDQAKEKAEKCLEYGINVEASRILSESKRKLSEEEESKAVEEYLDSLPPDQVEALHKRTEEMLRLELSPAIFSVIMKQGREGAGYRAKFFGVASAYFAVESRQMNLL